MMACAKRSGLFLSLFLFFAACNSSDSTQARKIADPALDTLSKGQDQSDYGDGNRKAILSSLFDAKALPDPKLNLVRNANEFFEKSSSLLTEAKTGLTSAIALNIPSLQKKFYQLQSNLCDAYLDYVGVATNEMKTLEAFIARSTMPLDPTKLAELQNSTSSDEQELTKIQKSIIAIRKEVDALIAENPSMFQELP